MEQEQLNEPKMQVHPSIFKVIEQRKALKERLSNIKHKIGVYSAKGGVGKTTTAVNIAYTLSLMGYKVGLLDADVDCPNLTMFLGINTVKEAVYPLIPIEKDGVKVLSTAMFLDDKSKPIIWRGPMIGKMISEFFSNTEWGDLDYLILDLPPGTSDSPLSIIQLLDLDGFVIVTTPQHISAVNAIRSGMMAKRLGVALLGVIENMSDGEARGGKEVAAELDSEVIGLVPFDKKMSEMSDRGEVAVLNDEGIKNRYEHIVKKLIGGG